MTHGEVALVVIAGCTALAAWLAFEQLARPRRRRSREPSMPKEQDEPAG